MATKTTAKKPTATKKTAAPKQAPQETANDIRAVLDRLEAEFDTVSDNYEKLNDALINGGDAFVKKVGEEQYGLLAQQAGFMLGYRNTLALRITLLRRKFNKLAAKEY